VKPVKPIYDDGGAPLCSEGCPWYVIECDGGKRSEYCSHRDAPDPQDSWCRPMVLLLLRVNKTLAGSERLSRLSRYGAPDGSDKIDLLEGAIPYTTSRLNLTIESKTFGLSLARLVKELPDGSLAYLTAPDGGFRVITGHNMIVGYRNLLRFQAAVIAAKWWKRECLRLDEAELKLSSALETCLYLFQNYASEEVYGFFPGGDPRRFAPDPDGSTEAEREAWREDCETWNRLEAMGAMPEPKPSCCRIENGMILTRNGYGLGTYSIVNEEADEMVRLCEEALGVKP